MLIGKDVFALFGDTGVGKTTIAQILLGYTLIKCQNSS
jgi:ABC-type glutathione transport system ATPase component